MRRRRGRSLPSLLALAAVAVGCGKSQPATILLTISDGASAAVPDEVRLRVFGPSGEMFPETRLPSQGTLVPASDAALGTLVIYVKQAGVEVRLEARGLVATQALSQGTARATPEPGRQIAVNLVLGAGLERDADRDGVPDAIDDCVYVANAEQSDSDGDGVGDACASADAGVLGGAAIGSACVLDQGCVSLHCADGLCCDNACDGPCFSCALAGAQGTCTAIPAGQDSQGDCPVDPAATCGRTGKCAAGGACALYPDGAACSPAACVGGSQTSASTCDGAGSCRPSQTIACGLYACAGPVCAQSCTSDAECAGGTYCLAPACVPKLDVGAPCGAPNQCTSGFCADGVCCASDCSGPCKSCVSPTVGSCTNYAAGTDPDADCALGLSCTGAGACFQQCAQDSPDCETGYYCAASACSAKKALGATCGGGHECDSGFCTDGVCCSEACTETCRSCNVAGSVGTCAFVPNGVRDPNGPNPCGPPNRCDGAGTCQ